MSLIGYAWGATLLATNVRLLCLLGVSSCILGFVFVPFLQNRSWQATPQPPRAVITSRRETNHTPAASDAARNDPPRPRKWSLRTALNDIKPASKQTIQMLATLVRDRLTLLTMLIYLCDETAIYIRVVFPQWASKGFAWTLAEVNAVMALQILITCAVLLALPSFTKRVLRPRVSSQRMVDRWMIQSSLTLNIMGLLLVSVAPTRWLYIVALAIYNLGVALPDALRSFVSASMQGEGQMQRMYAGISMIEAIAGVAGTTLWSTTFAAGLQYGGVSLARGCFFAAAALFALSLYMTIPLQRLTSAKLRTSTETSEV